MPCFAPIKKGLVRPWAMSPAYAFKLAATVWP